MTVSLTDFDVVLLDIEGTICPISFVRDVLFPHALDALPKVLSEQWDSTEFATYRDAFPNPYCLDKSAFETHVRDLVAKDVKVSYLKAFQSYLWQNGYESGQIKAPLFPDVAPFVTRATSAGKKIMIYSSGSVLAQKLLFRHTTGNPSDISPMVSDWFDTVNAGPKTEIGSYKNIMEVYPDIKPTRWLFLSDNIAEVEAAIGSGMTSLPVSRPGNSPLPADKPISSTAIADFEAELS